MSEYKELEVIVLAGLAEMIFIGIALLCGIWLIIARILKDNGRNIPFHYFRIPQKITFFCSIAFVISFGLCSAWLFLPQILK